MPKIKILVVLVVVIVGIIGIYLYNSRESGQNVSSSLNIFSKDKKAQKLYWFIPDGMRAEPDLFNIYQWAKEGKLPNIKKMIENGTFGYSIPTFPSHTPTNFATLLTGAYPKTHGVADGPMHVEGKPLDKPSLKGFASSAKKVTPAWNIFENSGKKVALLSIPGSTPPELKEGITVRGRWSGWGADTDALIFEPEQNLDLRKKLGRAVRLFFLGSELTKFVKMDQAADWENIPTSYSVAFQSVFPAYGANFYAYIFDSTDDGKTNYDKVLFSKDKKQHYATLTVGKWSDWQDVELVWKNNEQELKFDSNVKYNPQKVIHWFYQ